MSRSPIQELSYHEDSSRLFATTRDHHWSIWLRALESIEELEPRGRGVYCGSTGYIGNDGSMNFSIAIRTLIYSEGRIGVWVGGGIVADSVTGVEFQETLDKAKAMLLRLRQAPRLRSGARV